MATNRQQQQRLLENLADDLGPGILDAIHEESVTGIKVGADGLLFVKRHSRTWDDTGLLVTREARESVSNLIASQLGKVINERSPLLQGELPLTGDRVQVWGPPVADYAFVIRRHSSQIYPLEDYVAKEILTQEQADLLRWHVQHESNIVVSGSTDSGKSTFCNALLALLTGTDHVLILEDTVELKCPARNVTRLQTTPHVPLEDLVRSSLRADPNRVVIGETRGAEGYYLLEAWTTGRRGGITTVHSDSAAGALQRFGMFCLKAGLVTVPWLLIESALDLIVQIKMTPNGRKVTELMEVTRNEMRDIPIRLTSLGTSQAVTQH